MDNPKYKFTSDWVSSKTEIWKQVLEKLTSKNKFLEVGSYEGRSAIWFIENGLSPNGEITCIDNWVYKDKETFNSNLAKALIGQDKQMVLLEGNSVYHLASLVAQSKKYDLVYIDGGHKNKEVLTDAVLCWELINVGGILVFDDYLYSFRESNVDHSVKRAVDAFCNLFQDGFIYLYVGQQVIIKKQNG